MAEIRDASGVSLRRIYALHPSKRDLVATWLNDRHDRWMSWFSDTIDRYVGRGTDPVVATFDALREWRRTVAVLVDGAIVQSAIFGNDKPITAARRAAAKLLEAMP